MMTWPLSEGLCLRGIENPMQQTCLFCQIAKGKEKATVVFEDKRFIAFLDKRPLFPGHCLLMPKRHFTTLYDLPQSLIKPLFTLTQKIGEAIENAMQAEGSFIAINNQVSQSVPHLHIHIVPRKFKDGLKGFFWPRQNYQDEEHARQIQAAIKKQI